MINIETLLSSFDERGTLLKWLKAVEKALQDATLTRVDVETISTTQIKLKFVFEDGTSIETPTITLPKGDKGDKGDTGEQGETGETGADGVSVTNVEIDNTNHLICTLSSGTEIDCGSLNVNAENFDSGEATNGQVLTADGSGGASWQNASGGSVKASNIDSETATSGQLLTANGSGGASWQNDNSVKLDTNTQSFSGSKDLTLPASYNEIKLKNVNDQNMYTRIASYFIHTQYNMSNYIQLQALNTGCKLNLNDNGTYKSFTMPSASGQLATVSNITAKVPDAPDTDGTYVLKCVVSSGVKTYQWVLES